MSWIGLVAGVHVLACILLIAAVLFQGGENVDITAAFGGASQTAFGPRGTVTAFQKFTWGLGVIFVITSVTLTIWATRHTTGSILEGSPAKSAPAPPSSPVPAPK